ncbi:MAG: substrate-binding domain-containing protein [Trueperaceae bacterium]|nr:substrate-binding domain-containing protein [Trueperaceae bacterium]
MLAPVTDDREHITILRDQSIPVVLVDRTVPDADLDVVRSDVRQGGRQMTEHLLEHGHRRIAFIGGRRELSSLQERLRGYEDAMGSRDLPTTVELGNFDRASGVAAVDQLFGPMRVAGAAKVTALVAANNYVAVGAVARLRELGLRVPGDVSIVSFDDFEVEALIDPFFTVVKQPAYDIGRHAAAMLLERMSGLAVAARELVLPVTFIERHSVERLRSTRR